MKRVAIIATLIISFSASYVYAYTSPGKPQGFVNDFAKVLSVEQVSTLNKTLSDFSSQTTNQISVVTIPALGDETIETYAVKLFEEWKIGQKGRDNGVLFLIAPTDKKVRIEVGYGLEGVLTDAQSNGIIQKIILPEFKVGNIEKGIVNGTNAILSVVKSEASYSIPEQSITNKANFNYWELVIYFIFLIGFSLVRIMAKSKSWWLGGVLGGLIGIVAFITTGLIIWVFITVVLILVGLLIDFLLSKFVGDKFGRGGGFWGGFGGGGSGGGGFGGFGGGGSGGGGSSGSW